MQTMTVELIERGGEKYWATLIDGGVSKGYPVTDPAAKEKAEEEQAHWCDFLKLYKRG